MAGDGWLARLLRSKLRGAGRTVEKARAEYDAGRAGLPTDGDGRARIVCRRHAEERAVRLDDADRPGCFDPDHADCRGCLEDVRAGRVETW